MVAEALELAARIARGLGHHTCAGRLLGASESWSERNGLSRYIPAQAVYDREIAALCSVLGEEALRAARMEGRAFRPEDALNQVAMLG